jgi:hypothetical protein
MTLASSASAVMKKTIKLDLVILTMISAFSMLSVEQIQSAQTEHMPPLDEASRLADLIEKGNGLHNKAKEVARESKNAASMPCILTQLFGTTRLHQIEALCRVWPMR